MEFPIIPCFYVALRKTCSVNTQKPCLLHLADKDLFNFKDLQTGDVIDGGDIAPGALDDEHISDVVTINLTNGLKKTFN